MELAVREIREATGAELRAGDPERVCTRCVIDSREAGEGALFVAFPGERVDGNDFAAQAIEAGAAAVALTREPTARELELAAERGCAVFTVDDAEGFLLALAHRWRRALGCTVVGITGSIGKTTTKDILAGVLARRFRVHVTGGNFNNLIGMPLTILAASRGTEVLVLEMGMNSRGEIERLTRCAEPSLAVITKVGTSHIGMLGSRENIARAKAEIVDGMVPVPQGAAAGEPGAAPLLVLTGEDAFTPFIAETFARPAGVEVLLAGFEEPDAVRASAVELDDEGRPHFALKLEDGTSIDTMLSITGRQSVANAVLAAAVACRLGASAEDIDQAFRALAITGRRQEIRRARCAARIIDDSYNASPESTAAALDLMCTLPARGRRIAVLGEIGELGDESARLHGLVGAYAAAKKPDLLVCVGGPGAEEMLAAARLMGLDEDVTLLASSAEEVARLIAGDLTADDTVLVKGSRFVGLDRFVEEVC
ncbi:UDP-N-acetylmuramoyl-tripeptide--D-alanyl-D-alanine ligase [Enorma burkinafasonensis]|uniref:UDP-N-acetylmuramoyl-tripeptide--D-alanyl-D- alanine ligase n=1 Tax=Enorma burkinafasonensis TaxID=2590867 RepID=UPI0026ECCF4A|nr:UDP-N-acetylmuramoyl-tripeptide--D-alanyl-D-alanine ligase [Enorma burkinafasonensis]MCI7731197.1 UDP-N-acetylmuramoyl-tripeptide--D-alanyl-D-alanine ligase [Enorma burkinafasonensis]